MDGESWLTSELASFACGACGQAYGEERIRLIAQRDELFFVDLACGHCGSQAVAIVTVQVTDERSAGTEPSPDETSPEQDGRADAPPISSDDVLDVHHLLADLEGDVHDLLSALEGPAA